MKCPECDSKKIEVVAQKMSESGELYEVDVCQCIDCGCEFDSEEAKNE